MDFFQTAPLTSKQHNFKIEFIILKMNYNGMCGYEENLVAAYYLSCISLNTALWVGADGRALAQNCPLP